MSRIEELREGSLRDRMLEVGRQLEALEDLQIELEEELVLLDDELAELRQARVERVVARLSRSIDELEDAS